MTGGGNIMTVSGECQGRGSAVNLITVLAEEFPGSSSCALSLIDLKDGTCSEFMIFTDDLTAFQEYVQAHNAQEGEFTVDLQSGFFQR
jgi:hypothetical protein